MLFLNHFFKIFDCFWLVLLLLGKVWFSGSLLFVWGFTSAFLIGGFSI